MKSIKFISLALFAGILSFILYSCSKSDTYDNMDDPGNFYKVSITATQFDPASITMLQGYKITWTNMDTETHSIVTDDGITINSGNIPAGASFSFTPTVTGSFPYHCGIHPAVTGTLNVVNK